MDFTFEEFKGTPLNACMPAKLLLMELIVRMEFRDDGRRTLVVTRIDPLTFDKNFKKTKLRSLILELMHFH
jgi:hypothetical protein